MQSAHMREKKISYRSHSVWLSAFFLTLMVLATAAALGTCLYSFVHRSDYVIDLFGGDTADAQFASQKSPNVNTYSSQLVVTGSSASQSRGNDSDSRIDVDASDSTGVWTTDTDIELFHTSYKNADGKVTVRSGNSDKIVAPGTEGSYTFSVKNTGKKAADCKMWMETQMNLTFSDLPFQIRLAGSDGWLIGTETEWKNASELDTVSVTEYIPAGKSMDYTLYWQWPFEEDIDGLDTKAGNITASQGLDYNVTIHTQASESTRGQETTSEATEEVQNTEKSGAAGQTTESVRTGDATQIWLWMILLAAAAAVILLLSVKRWQRR